MIAAPRPSATGTATQSQSVVEATTDSGRSIVGRLSTYARLGKFTVYQHWAGLLVAGSLLTATTVATETVVTVLVLLFFAYIFVMAAVGALDDIQGKRDGLDQANYRRQDQLRKIRRKPLLLEEVGEREALRFAKISAVLGVGAGLAAFLVAPGWPLWILIAFVAGAVLATQYSYGLKLSYIGGAEALLFITTAGTVALPVILIEGGLTSRSFLEPGIVGAWMLQISVFSNTVDAVNDRSTGRLTLAALLTEHQNKIAIQVVFFMTWIVTVAGIAAGVLPVWLLFALVPCWSLQILQLFIGLRRGQPLRARALGFRAFDLGILALIVSNLV